MSQRQSDEVTVTTQGPTHPPGDLMDEVGNRGPRQAGGGPKLVIVTRTTAPELAPRGLRTTAESGSPVL
jgi:hypothetical protein